MACDPAERWHLRLLPLMRAALVLMAIFFFGASLFQYLQVHRDINQKMECPFKVIAMLGVDLLTIEGREGQSHD